MITLFRLLRIFLVAGLLMSCAVFSPAATPQPPASTDAPFPFASPTSVATAPEEPTLPAPTDAADPTDSPAVPAITEEMLAYFVYQAPYTADSRLPLVNGEYAFSQEDPPVRVYTRLMTSAFGDLNAVGVEDAVVVLATNTGGTGTFFDLIALLNQNGAPLQIASSGFGDRQMVKSLRVENGRIILDYMTQAPTDGACCPSQHNLRTYVLEGGLLSLTSEQVLESEAAQATPLPNHIIIDRPQPSEQILGNVISVSGRVSQTPPSGMLVYHLLDMQNNLILEGTFPVSGAPGQTGSFSFQVPLDGSVQFIATIEVVDAENGALRGRTPLVVLLPQQ